ncbi:pitrilysin family protein [Pedobacter sp. SYSU D00535]|uniref:M16 family metallopeptidase n=1 Tax=Pedobacter sp. SYSU D00535 TaxID=2810308 RepID=UPI001A956F8B|nr:M16 family metallopeptidase [Pedobacter sp. SYSU D00535]
MRQKLLIAMLLLAFTSASNSQVKKKYEWKSASSGGYTYRYVSNDPTNARFYQLKNGLTVILSPTPKQPRIQAYFAVKAGSKTDPENHTGLAHYLEHMLFKGTDKFGTLDWNKEKPLLDQIDNLYEQYNSTKDEQKRREIYKQIDKVSGEAAKYAIANEYDKVMASMGAQGTNAFTSFEQTVYTEDIPSNAVDKFLAVQAERFRNPILRIFHTELEAVYEEKNRTLDNDGRKVFEKMFENLFPNSYGKQTTIGTVEHLKNPSLKAIREYYKTYYVPNNIGIILSGDFNPDEMVKKIDRSFAYMKAKPVPAYTFSPEKPLSTAVAKEVWGPNPESIMIGFRFPGANTSDAQMLNLLGSILTNGKAGLFDLNLVKKQKLLAASAFNYNLKDYSTLLLQGNPIKGQSLDDVKALMIAEIEKLKKGDFDEDLIPSIVNNLKKSILEENESYGSRAGALMDAFTSEVDWKTTVATADQLSAVTKQQVMAFAKKYLGNNYVVVYKRQGEDKNKLKVEKPTITAVEVNREAQSPFLQQINSMPVSQVKPVWLDFSKDIARAKSGNLDVLSVQNKENSIFKLYYRYNTGSWHNKLLPIAAEYIQFLATDKMSAEEISKEFYKLAGSFRISVSGEITTVNITGLQENYEKTVALYENLLANCKPDEAALAGLKARLKKSRENAKLNKASIMQGLVTYAQYGPSNPFNNVLSNAELDALTADQLIGALRELSLYEHTIAYYGPASANTIATSLKSLHPSPASFKPLPEGPTFAKVVQSKNQVLFANYDMVQAEIQWIRNGSGFSVQEVPAIELFNNYFGNGMSTIVFQTIRESKALAYSTYAVYNGPAKKDDRYTMLAYVGTQADKLNEAIASMNELLTELPESEKVIEVAKANMRKSLETERIINEDIIFNYLNAQRKGLDSDIRKNTFESIDKLQFTDIKKFHETELRNKPYTYCVVASEAKVNEADLNKYGELTKLSLETIFGY